MQKRIAISKITDDPDIFRHRHQFIICDHEKIDISVIFTGLQPRRKIIGKFRKELNLPSYKEESPIKV